MTTLAGFHLLLHFLLPALVAATLFRADWKRACLVMVATMLVDLDHLLAEPIFDPNRCSVGFHPLHRALPVAFYAVLALLPRPLLLRYAGAGLVLHMLLDSLDCRINTGAWWV